MGGDTGFITDTLAEVQETGVAHCALCPADDDEIVVEDANDWGDVLVTLAEHGIDEHNLPERGPWTNEMLENAKEEP